MNCYPVFPLKMNNFKVKDFIMSTSGVINTSSYMYTEQTKCLYNNHGNVSNMSSWIRLTVVSLL